MLPPTAHDYLISITNLVASPPWTIPLYGIAPDDIAESHSAQFEDMNIMSRSGVLMSYTGGNARSITLTFTVHEDYIIEYEGQGADIRQYVAQIKALTYPEYAGTSVIPPKVRLRAGKFILLQGVCSSVTVTWRKPIRKGRYIVADCSIEIMETNSESFAASEIITMGDLRRV